MGRRKTREQPGPEPFFKPQLFVTGGQTGADSIPLSVYRDLGVGVTGWMPRGFLRDDGRGSEVAQQHGLREGEGSYGWRDRANAAESDACLALLTTKPRTGKGTMQTVNIFVNGEHEFVVLTKPSAADYLVIPAPAGHPWRRPVLVFWDITEAKLVAFAEVLRGWLATFRPARLMLAGPLETSWPGIERLGAKLLVRALTASDPELEPEPEPEQEADPELLATLVRQCKVIYMQVSRKQLPHTATVGNTAVLAELATVVEATLAASRQQPPPFALLCKGWLAIHHQQLGDAEVLLERGTYTCAMIERRLSTAVLG